MAEPRREDKIELFAAVKNGFQTRVKDLLNLNPLDINDETYFDYYLVMTALINRKIICANFLIEKGCRVYKESKTNNQRTALHAAIQLKNMDLITTILAKGASNDILTLNKQNKTPFHLAIDNNQFSVIELFLSNCDVKALNEKYLLHYAIENDNASVVKQLIGKGLSITMKNQENLTPFCVALRKKTFDILEILLSHHSVENIKENDHDNIAPVFIAIICDNLEAIKKYANSGLSINLPLKLDVEMWTCLSDQITVAGFTLLHFAVKLIKLKLVKLLLKIGADILVQSDNGLSPLHIAFEAKEKGIWKTSQEFDNNNLIIDTLLKANTKLKSNPINKHGLSHFHVACSRDDPTVIEHFFKFGVSINQPVNSECYLYKEYSPLHFAAKFSCKKTMELLLKNKAVVKQMDFNKMTALHVAAKESCLDTVNLLLKYDSEIASIDSMGNTPIHLAFESKNYKIIDLLFSVPKVTDSNPVNSKGISLFHIACTRNNVDVVNKFIENGVNLDSCALVQSTEEDVVDYSGYSALHFAICHNRSEIVELLLNNGANIKIRDSKRVTPSHLAFQYTHKMFEEYIESMLCKSTISKQCGTVRKVDTIVRKYNFIFGVTPHKFYWSPNRKEHLKIMNLLLDSNESDVNEVNGNGNTLVFYAYAALNEKELSTLKNNLNCTEYLWNMIVESLSEEILERKKSILNELMNLKVNLDKSYKNGSILHYICKNYSKGSDELMELFLRNDASVDALDEEMLTPLLQACIHHKKQLISILLDYGANLEYADPKDNSTPLLISASKSNESAPTFDGIRIFETLITRGANVNARLSNGKTALHILVSLDGALHLSSKVSALIKAGADINSRDSDGFTPLHLACDKKNGPIEILLLQGGDINVEDNYGRSVCCYFYEKQVKDLTRDELDNDVKQKVKILYKQIMKMNFIGLPVSEKVMLVKSQFDNLQVMKEIDKLICTKKCEDDLRLLRDTEIHSDCTLYDVMFKNENALSQLAKNPTLKNIALGEPFRHTYLAYGYLLQLKYQDGVYRGKILPEAKWVLSSLAGINFPDACSENICKNFTNPELRESTGILRSVLNLKVGSSDDVPMRKCKMNKRQKIN